jgi:hypothetical protein
VRARRKKYCGWKRMTRCVCARRSDGRERQGSKRANSTAPGATHTPARSPATLRPVRRGHTRDRLTPYNPNPSAPNSYPGTVYNLHSHFSASPSFHPFRVPLIRALRLSGSTSFSHAQRMRGLITVCVRVCYLFSTPNSHKTSLTCAAKTKAPQKRSSSPSRGFCHKQWCV